MYQVTGLGAKYTALELSQMAMKKSAEDLASQRRIYEAEMAQKDAIASSAELQSKVMTWLPRIAIGLGVIIGAYVFWQRRKGKGK